MTCRALLRMNVCRAGNKAVKPRVVGASSVPGMLAMFQVSSQQQNIGGCRPGHSCAVLRCVMLCHVTVDAVLYAVLHAVRQIMLYYAMRCYALLCCSVLLYAMLFCAVCVSWVFCRLILILHSVV